LVKEKKDSIRIHVGIAVTHWLSILLFHPHDQYDLREHTHTHKQHTVKERDKDRTEHVNTK
jgi:hypothetical protein